MIKPANGRTYTCEELQWSIEKQIANSTLKELKGDMALQHAVCGLTEEAGEVAGLLKREVYKQCPVPRERWVEELGDVMWYLIDTARERHISLDEIFDYNQRKLSERYGQF